MHVTENSSLRKRPQSTRKGNKLTTTQERIYATFTLCYEAKLRMKRVRKETRVYDISETEVCDAKTFRYNI